MRRLLAAKKGAFEAAGDGTLVVSNAGRILDANESGRAAIAALHGSRDANERALCLPEGIEAFLRTGKQGPHVLRTQGNQFFEIWASQHDAAGELRGVRALVIRDFTDRRLGERKLLQLAHYDSLTGLANRRLFIEKLGGAMRRLGNRAWSLGLLYIDLDHFKEVNDTLGHGAGDELLQIVAERFRRRFDAMNAGQAAEESAHVFRLGGDEFAVILLGLENDQFATHAATAVLDAASAPMEIGGRNIVVSGTVGIAVAPRDGTDVETLVKHADAALYAAKSLGRSRFEFYRAEFSDDSDRKYQIEQHLRRAIEENELSLHYQPKVDLETRTVASFEALLRWNNSVLGAVGPYEFIPIAEERGIIDEIGAWCLDTACAQIRAWRDAGLDAVPVAVNVSSSQFATSNVGVLVSQALMRHQLDPSAIEIELTESLLLQDRDDTSLCLRDLRAIGIRVALDDFGTGYSALNYLNQFPLDIVKMDRGFLREMENSDNAAGIVSAVVSMCHSLGLTVVAEGVDSEQQLTLLCEMGCDEAQGFLFSPALPADQVERFMAPSGSVRPTIAPRPIAPGMLRAVASVAAPTRAELGRAMRVSEVDSTPKVTPVSPRRAPARILGIECGAGSIGPISLRLMRLGFDMHHASSVDEARLLIAEDGIRIDVVVVSPESDLAGVAEIVELLTKANPDITPSLIVLGDEPKPARRESIRQAGARWILCHPFEDGDLRFLMNAAVSRPEEISNRKVPRAPVNAMAWIRAGSRRESGVISTLSENGAFIETSATIDQGTNIRLEFALPTGRVRAYAEVLYCVEEGDGIRSQASAGIGIRFFDLERGTVYAIREAVHYYSQRYLP